MRLYSPVDLTGNLIMIEKLVSGGTWTGDLPIILVNGRWLNAGGVKKSRSQPITAGGSGEGCKPHQAGSGAEPQPLTILV